MVKGTDINLKSSYLVIDNINNNWPGTIHGWKIIQQQFLTIFEQKCKLLKICLHNLIWSLKMYNMKNHLQTFLRPQSNYFYLVFLLATFLISCSPKIAESDLIGSYSYIKAGSRDTIFILDYYKYIQKYINQKDTIYTLEGTWSFSNKGQEIKFSEYRTINYQDIEGPKGTWFAKVKKVEDEIHIMYSSEDNIYYFKKAH